MARLELDNVRVSYSGVRVIPGLSLTVEDGECIALLGPSGCGKTTTLRAVAGFVRPDAGHVRIGGRDMTDCPPHKRNVGLVFQDYALFSHMTVAENVAYGLVRRRVPKADIAAKVSQTLCDGSARAVWRALSRLFVRRSASACRARARHRGAAGHSAA